jgi:3-hydroxyisobutyrate dehydrogenase-like beta-hydroxyacid dehydrogenase
MANKAIGFIGVGMMGHGMAKNLVEKGFSTTILGHRNRTPVDDLVKRGAREARDVADLMASSDIVFLCVTGSPQVEDLIYRKGGIADTARAGQIIVDTSTSQPMSTLKIADALKAKDARFVDAPLSRTPADAAQGRLNVMVGADAQTFAEIEPALQAFCENIFHVGGIGAGHKIKLINNFGVIGQLVLISEMMAACVKLDIDPKVFVELFGLGASASPMFKNVAGKAVNGDFTGHQFALTNAAKDMRYYSQMAADAGIAGPAAAVTTQSLLAAVNLGFDQPDHFSASLIKAQAVLNGVEFPPAGD